MEIEKIKNVCFLGLYALPFLGVKIFLLATHPLSVTRCLSTEKESPLTNFSPISLPILEKKLLVSHQQQIKSSFILPSHRNLYQLLKEEGFSPTEALLFSRKISRKYLRIGQKIIILHRGDAKNIDKIILPLHVGFLLESWLTPQGSVVFHRKKVPVTSRILSFHAKITHTLFDTFLSKKLAPSVIMPLLRSLSHAGLNWRSSSYIGSRISILYKELRDKQTKEVAFDRLLFVKIQEKNKKSSFYAYASTDSSRLRFYNALGIACKGQICFLKRPLTQGTLSSSFGMRFHPIHHRMKMHKGVDFAAPMGTPVLAAAPGVVEKIGIKGGYGRCVQIVHSNGYRTFYAHLKGFKSGINVGSPLLQGSVIGYVGKSGHATGPHLHFEVRQGNCPVNPLKTIFVASSLTGQRKVAFQAYVRHLNALYQKEACSGSSL